jgi:hypothetical protein
MSEEELARLRVELKLEREWRERAERDLKQANEEIGALRYRLEQATRAQHTGAGT